MMLLTWKRLDAGEYESQDGRWHILKTYDNVYGNHWMLSDQNEPDYYRSKYHEYSLKDAKAKAQGILNAEVNMAKKE